MNSFGTDEVSTSLAGVPGEAMKPAYVSASFVDLLPHYGSLLL